MTLKEQVSMFDELSVAVHVTVVSPNGNTEPDAGTQATVGAGSTASVAVGSVNVTVDDVVSPKSGLEVIFAGQVPIVGGSVSTLKKKTMLLIPKQRSVLRAFG